MPVDNACTDGTACTPSYMCLDACGGTCSCYSGRLGCGPSGATGACQPGGAHCVYDDNGASVFVDCYCGPVGFGSSGASGSSGGESTSSSGGSGSGTSSTSSGGASGSGATDASPCMWVRTFG
jgi:hypothetical protein